MVTKWKSKGILALYALLIAYGVSGMFALFTFLQSYQSSSYFHTPNFSYELQEFAGMITDFELNDLSLTESINQLTVTDEEKNTYPQQQGNLSEQIAAIESRYYDQIQEAEYSDANENSIQSLISKRNQEIEEVTKQFTDDTIVTQQIKKEKISRLESYYQQRESYQEFYHQRKQEFAYYFENPTTGEFYTNTTKEQMDDLTYVIPYTLYNDYSFVDSSGGESSEIINQLIPDMPDGLEGRIGVFSNLESESQLAREIVFYDSYRQYLFIHLGTALLAWILVYVMRRKSTMIPTTTAGIRLPVDGQAMMLIISSGLAIFFAFLAQNEVVTAYDSPFMILGIVGILLLSACLWAVVLFYGKTVIKNIQDKQAWTQSYALNIWNRINKTFEKAEQYAISEHDSFKAFFHRQSIRTQLATVLTIVFMLGFSAVFMLFHSAFIWFYIILLGVVGIPLVMKLWEWGRVFSRVTLTLEKLARGDWVEIEESKGYSKLETMLSQLKVLQDTLKNTRHQQAKSERLKTELITNVSHDLRTPLTSIITYTQLLKQTHFSTKESSDYLDIIEGKSIRLKSLIDDLFEVSKMASGTIELRREKVDVVQLLTQALAERDDEIGKSSLQFRMAYDQEQIFLFVDGQKVWRVFDNLIGNILKYSLDHTRVYIETMTSGEMATIIFKNISKYELQTNTDELAERFKRGDTSRHTEGSGLGLAIAQSIVELHDGTLLIENDGDLFKVTLMFHTMNDEAKEAV